MVFPGSPLKCCIAINASERSMAARRVLGIRLLSFKGDTASSFGFFIVSWQASQTNDTIFVLLFLRSTQKFSIGEWIKFFGTIRNSRWIAILWLSSHQSKHAIVLHLGHLPQEEGVTPWQLNKLLSGLRGREMRIPYIRFVFAVPRIANN